MSGEPRPALTKKDFQSEEDVRWCPGCGDYAVLAAVQSVFPELGIPREKLVIVSGIGCSSRFPYFVQAHGAHFIHGRALPFATGVSLSRPDLHVFVFSGDGDAFSIGGNHFTHTARKNVKMSLVVMDNEVYGLTKKQTSPTSPLGYKSKTDVWGAVDQPINPLKQAIAAGATFVARTTSTNPNHLRQMMEAAMDHDGFSFIECLSECVEFFPGAFDAANPRKGGAFNPVPTAVPPRQSSIRRGSAAFSRSMPLATCRAYPENSWPSVSGVASIRCVRPVFTMSMNRSDLALSVF